MGMEMSMKLEMERVAGVHYPRIILGDLGLTVPAWDMVAHHFTLLDLSAQILLVPG